MSLVAGRPPQPGDLSVLQHLARCPRCQSALAFSADAALAFASKADVPLPLPFAAAWNRLTAHAGLRRRFEAGESDALAAAAGDNRLVFRSTPGTPPDLAWKAEILIAAPDDPSATHAVRMLPLGGTLPSEGQLMLFGIPVPIRDASGSLPPRALANVAPKASVSFVFPSGAESSGIPVLASLE